MAISRRRADPDGITGARIAGTASRYARQEPLDPEAAVNELRAIANGRGDLLAERAGELLGSREEDEPTGMWPHRALEAALCIAAGADLTLLCGSIEEGQRHSKGVR